MVATPTPDTSASFCAVHLNNARAARICSVEIILNIVYNIFDIIKKLKLVKCTKQLKVMEDILTHINDAYAPNTIRVYRADFNECISFCVKKGACPLPVDPFVVSEFLLGLADAKNNRASTIGTKCASISAIHRYGYFEDPTKHPEVKISIRKINRKLSTCFKQTQPINRHMLDKMLDLCGDDLRGIRNRMILLLLYTTLRRRSELTSLGVEDLTQCSDGQDFILLRQSKTDQTREGVLLALDIETSLTIRNWIRLAGISENYLLRETTGKRLNQSMDPGQISRTFKSLAVKAKLRPRTNQRAIYTHCRSSGHAVRRCKHQTNHDESGLEQG
jgi:site-specific recombinase XerD